MATKQWSYDEVKLLITEYEKHPCLYNTILRDYKDRAKRKAALNEIAEKFDTTGDEVINKFQRLRSQYNRERAKLLNGSPNGCTADRMPKVTWGHFDSLHFLAETGAVKGSRPSCWQPEEQPLPMCDAEDIPEEKADQYNEEMFLVYDNTPSTKTTLPPKKKRKKIEEKNMHLDKHVFVLENMGQKQESREDIFGKFVASELKTMKDEFTKKRTMHEIINLLFEA